MIVKRSEIVKAARTYLGTKYVHQGRHRDYGVDCVGLPICTIYDVGLGNIQVANYSRQSNPKRFRGEIRKYLDEISFDQLEPGDGLTFFVDTERHFGIVSSLDPLTIIHAHNAIGKVVETPVDESMKLKIRGCWRVRDSEAG